MAGLRMGMGHGKRAQGDILQGIAHHQSEVLSVYIYLQGHLDRGALGDQWRCGGRHPPQSLHDAGQRPLLQHAGLLFVEQ